MELLKLNTKFDLNKALDGNRNVFVQGLPNTDNRRKLIERAITKIQEYPETAFSEKYIGFKNYAGFGDQEVVCEYGYGPRHGSVVYRIGRRNWNRNKSTLGENEIYLLECVRDFGYVEDMDGEKINFCKLLDRLEKIVGQYDEVVKYLNDFEPDTHQPVAV